MPNPTAGQAAPATIAGTNPTKGAPNRRPMPPRRLAAPAEAEPLTPADYAERMLDIGMHLWAVIDGVFDQQHTERGKAEPVPQWVLDRLKDQGRHRASHDELSEQATALGEMLRLQDGLPSRYTYEVWGDRSTRLSIRHDSIAEAQPALDAFKASGKYPKAGIVRLSRLSGGWSSDPALLDTLVGHVRLAGTSMGLADDEDGFFQIQDETGRNVMLKPYQIEGHPVLERMSADDLASISAWIDHMNEFEARRKAEKGAP